MGKKRGSYAKTIKEPPKGEAWPRVAAWRNHAGMTQQELADTAKVSVGMISDLENYKVGYSRETLEPIARALKITVGMLFDVDPLTATGIPWARVQAANERQRAEIAAFILGKIGT